MIKRAYSKKNMTNDISALEGKNTTNIRFFFQNDIQGKVTRPHHSNPTLTSHNHCLFPKWLTNPPPSFSTVALPITPKHISTLCSGEIGPLKSGA